MTKSTDFKIGQWGRFCNDRLVKCLQIMSGPPLQVRIEFCEGYDENKYDSAVVSVGDIVWYDNNFANWDEAKMIMTNRLRR